MDLRFPLICASVVGLMATQPAHATSLQASPVLIEMQPAAPTSTVSVRNTGKSAFDVQTRIYRWTQKDGQESLEETDDVVTSPPITTLEPGATYSVRVVRTNGEKPKTEEAYRLLVDQLPDESKIRGGTVSLVMRHSIPVFVMPEATTGPRISWSVAKEGGFLVVRAANAGGRRVRLSAMTVDLGGGSPVSFGNGLVGYVLADGSMEWRAALKGRPVSTGQAAKITATTDVGPVNAAVKVTN